MASFRQHGNGWQAPMRWQGCPGITKTFEARHDTERWARAVESMSAHFFAWRGRWNRPGEGPQAHLRAVHWSLRPRMPAGNANPTRCRDKASPASR